MAKYCINCAAQMEDNQQFCPSCGSAQTAATTTTTTTTAAPDAKSKMVAGLLGIFLGAWGIHNFYLGNTGRGIAQIIVTIVTCGIGSLWGVIEGILILVGSINTDADGKPLAP
ncbi:MAG: TM2 domain-containing protein [Bacilli bacterium]|nr:TM2 domain-containing protein [Bacilli bacterium]